MIHDIKAIRGNISNNFLYKFKSYYNRSNIYLYYIRGGEGRWCLRLKILNYP